MSNEAPIATSGEAQADHGAPGCVPDGAAGRTSDDTTTPVQFHVTPTHAE